LFLLEFYFEVKMLSRAVFACGLVILALSIGMASARAQSPPTSSFRLAAVEFTGLTRFTQAQASAASALRVGDPITASQLTVAADRLSRSGVFESVSYKFVTRGEELTATFAVVENKNFLPCSFDNFVWFSTDQIDKTLRLRVPLYAGLTPQTGDTQKLIKEALRNLLQSNAINADVDVIPFSAGLSGPVAGIQFRVTGIAMPIRTVKFPASSAVSEKELETAAAQVIGRNFSTSEMTEFASVGLLPLYRQRGYLRAAFDAPQAAIIGNPPNGTAPDIALTIPVREGVQYFWEKSEWSGNHQFSTEVLEKTLGMKSKEISNQAKIDAGFDAVKKGYDKSGFIDATVRPTENIDDTTRLAAYSVTIHEGQQYHMGQIRFTGLSDKIAKDFIGKWQLKPGAVFDATYPNDFLQKIAFPKLLEMKMTNPRFNIKLQRNEQNGTVDVEISFQ
jgi:outer membrane protein assembly factor BamA